MPNGFTKAAQPQAGYPPKADRQLKARSVPKKSQTLNPPLLLLCRYMYLAKVLIHRKLQACAVFGGFEICG